MNQVTVFRLAAGLLVPALLLAGCGANPASTKKVKRKAPVVNALQGAPMMGPNGMPLMGPNGMPMAPGLPGQPAPEVLQMLDGMRRAQQQVPGFTATVDTYDKGPSGQESTTMKVVYKKPTTLRIEMIKASGQAQGAKILWTGGSSVRIKPSFIPMTVEKALTDDMLKSKNGWTLRETEVSAIFKVLFDPGSQIVPKGVQPIEGRPLAMFEVHSPASPKGATHEAIGIDGTTGLPGVRMLFKNETLIYKLSIKNLAIKAPSSSELEI
jgi:hypothetical protein